MNRVLKAVVYLLEVTLIFGYIGVALFTGASRPRDCTKGDLLTPKPETAFVSTAMGIVWPYTLYNYYQKTGSTADFFHRSGVICNPVAP